MADKIEMEGQNLHGPCGWCSVVQLADWGLANFIPRLKFDMSMTEQQLRLMYLAGTVSIPPRFPDLADITFGKQDKLNGRVFVTATQTLSPKLVIKRSFFADDVTSIFVPCDASAVDFDNGGWFEGDLLANKVYQLINKGSLRGIVYVREDAQSMLHMEAGLTAAESAQYYPPLPEDRSIDHYSMNPAGRRAGCD